MRNERGVSEYGCCSVPHEPRISHGRANAMVDGVVVESPQCLNVKEKNKSRISSFPFKRVASVGRSPYSIAASRGGPINPKDTTYQNKIWKLCKF